jgi:hypothetical protein
MLLSGHLLLEVIRSFALFFLLLLLLL